MAERLMGRAEKLVRDMLLNAKVRIEEIQYGLLIGGSSLLVPYQERVQCLFGKERVAGGQVSPDLAVAEGAGKQAKKGANGPWSIHLGTMLYGPRSLQRRWFEMQAG